MWTPVQAIWLPAPFELLIIFVVVGLPVAILVALAICFAPDEESDRRKRPRQNTMVEQLEESRQQFPVHHENHERPDSS